MPQFQLIYPEFEPLGGPRRSRESTVSYGYTRHIDFIWIGVLLSVVVHILFLLFLSRAPQTEWKAEKAIDVEFLSALPEVPQASVKIPDQIVSPPDVKPTEEEPPPDTKFKSDSNVKVEREQIKRGDAPDAGPAVGPISPPSQANKATTSKKASSKANPVEPKKSEAKTIKTLALDDKTLFEQFSPESKTQNLDDEINGGNTSRGVGGYQAFTRPPGSGARFLGLRGSNDYLPNLPDGDITLLNTKADKFAVFVRRVATQVFSQIRSTGWELLRTSDVNSISGFTTVTAILSPDGKLLSVKLNDGSGSNRFDEVLIQAVKNGARDSNPPKEALASDGNFHFVFKARSWSRWYEAPRTGAPMERRWLLLATGLE